MARNPKSYSQPHTCVNLLLMLSVLVYTHINGIAQSITLKLFSRLSIFLQNFANCTLQSL